MTERDPDLDPDEFDSAPPAPRVGGARRPLTRATKLLALASVATGIVLGLWISAPGPLAAPAPTPSTAAATPTVTPVDAAEIASLEARVSASPTDAAALQTLADRYARAQDWPHAVTWQGRLVTLRPTDADARLILGVYHFNADDVAAAERDWLEVIRQDPRNAEAMYNLGFLYLASDPPDEARAKAMWQRVVELDPSSDLAQAVSDQLAGLDTSSPSPSPTKG